MWRAGILCSMASLLVAGSLSSLAPGGLAQRASQTSSTVDLVWDVGTPMQSRRQGLAATGSMDGTVFAVGGTLGPAPDPSSPVTGLLEEYDPIANVWTTRASMPTPRADLALVMAPNGLLYAIGGTGENVSRRGIGPDKVLDAFEAYDPRTDTWKILPPMPTPRGRPGAAIGPDDKIYVVGGAVGLERFTSLERYDPATGVWQTLSPMPTPRWWLAFAAAPNGKLYAIGGLGVPVGDDISLEDDPLATVEEYDPDTDSWTERAPLSAPRWHMDAVTAPDGRIHLVAGHEASGAVATVESYDATTDSWQIQTPIPTARFALGVALSSDGWLCAIGGGPPLRDTLERTKLPLL